MISLQATSKSFGTAVALHPLALTFAAGKTTALIGPSGCGKSTILRLILGLLQPSSGAVEFDGQMVKSANALSARRRMGYVIQDGGLFPHLTAGENVLLLGEHLGRSPEAMQSRIRELCELTRLPAEALSRYPVELSGGQRQRVGLMRALALDPDVLLLDEPLGALDALVRASLQTDLKEIFQRLAKTVVLVTHDMGEAAFLADTIVLLRDGRLVQQGTLSDLRDRPADTFVTQFLSAQRSLVQW